MSRKLAAILLITTALLSGCSTKGLTGTAASGQTGAPGDAASSEQRVQVQTNFNSIKPGTVPQLSGTQKAQVDVKLNTTLKDLDSTLKSVQDGQDIDYNSAN